MKVFRTLGIAVLVSMAWSSLAGAQEPFTAGTWTATRNAPASPVAHALLLTDGSVLVNSMFFSHHADPWYRLIPNGAGSYINGTWTNAGTLPSGYNPLYFASSVLPSGQNVIVGGEDKNGKAGWTNLRASSNPASTSMTPYS